MVEKDCPRCPTNKLPLGQCLQAKDIAIKLVDEVQTYERTDPPEAEELMMHFGYTAEVANAGVRCADVCLNKLCTNSPRPIIAREGVS